MAKFKENGERARLMYVEEQKPIASIALDLGITEKTLHTWRKKGSWDKQKEEFLADKTSCHGALYKLLNVIVKKALDKYEQTGNPPDRDTLNFIKAMTDKLPKLKYIEELFEKEEINEERETSDLDIIKSIDDYLMGRKS